MIQFNDKLEVTDYDLAQMSYSWAKTLKNENIGIRTAFAAGFKAALMEVKKIKSNSTQHIITSCFTDNTDEILMFDKPHMAKIIIKKMLKWVDETHNAAYLIFTMYNENAGDEKVIGINWTKNTFVYQ